MNPSNDLLIRQRCEAMIEYGYAAMRQFPKAERHYCRYMDDFIIVHHDKQHLHRIRASIEDWLWHELRLKTNHKTQVFPVAVRNGRALDFLGYRIYPTHRRLRIDSIKRIKTKLRKFKRKYAAGEISLNDITPSIKSWVAHASHAQTFGLRESVLGAFRLK